MSGYVGRFAPSPTGALHAGSLVAALASWLDARAHGGRWLVRIEDIDGPRCVRGAAERILHQLHCCGLTPDEAPLYQSTRTARYQQALDGLLARALAYPCACTRREIDAALAAAGHQHMPDTARPYPGTCRGGLHDRAPRAWRFHTEKYQALLRAQNAATQGFTLDATGLHWIDRRLGAQAQDVAREVGDFVLRRADGLWAYQLAVTVDDGDQGVTHIVRGEDLADNTPRQLLLQHALGLAAPSYLHTPLVRTADGAKLSKQHGAAPIDERNPLQALAQAARHLGLPALPAAASPAQALYFWQQAWAQLYNRAP